MSQPSAHAPSLKQRQQNFLNGLAGVMAKRNTPLPPTLTGIPTPNYDPNNSPWSYIEPSAEIGSFRLANQDVSLFKLWGLVMQHGGAQALKANNGWPAICAEFNLPEEFSQMQANGSTSVALMLEQMYTAILYPFEDLYKKNVQEQQRKAQMASRQMSMSGQPGQIRGMPPNGMQPGPQQMQQMQQMQRGPMPAMANHTPQTPHQRPGSTALNPQMPSHNIALPQSTPQAGMTPASDSNLLDNDIQGIKRKLDMEDAEGKRARQKTDPLEGGQPNGEVAAAPATSSGQTRSRQPLRRKIEYVPWARELETYGGRDLRMIEHEYNTIVQRRPLRDINDWGTIDIEGLRMSIRSKIPTELSYALTTLTVLSTMRGPNPGSGFPIFQCPDLFDDLLDFVEEEAFGELQDDILPDMSAEISPITTHRQLLNAIYDDELQPFAALEHHQGSKNPNIGPNPRPGDIILTVVNMLRNLSVVSDNWQFLSRHDRLLEVMLRLCTICTVNGLPAPASKVLSLSDLVQIRKDTLYTLVSLATFIVLPPSSLQSPSVIRMSKRAFELVASYLVDPTEAVSPFASIQVAGQQLNAPPKPSALADAALEVFTRFSHSDATRQTLAQTIPKPHIKQLFEALVHRLPLTDMDFQLFGREAWLSYLEKMVMALYSLAFLAPPSLKQRLKADRKLGFKTVMFRLVHKFLSNPNPEYRMIFLLCCRRAIETMKVLDDEGDLFDTTETTTATLSFGMGFADSSDNTLESGSGLLSGQRDAAWDILMTREVFADENSHPPPTYSQEDPTFLDQGSPQNDLDLPHGPEILILPTVDSINFQKGYLGAEDERAAIEGEVQVKGVDQTRWSKLTVSLRTTEAAYDEEIELNAKELVLYTQRIHEPFPTTFSFSIPIPSDTPQSIHTPRSSLAHSLTASLHPKDESAPILSRSITVYTRRYTSHTHTLLTSPETHRLEDPTRVEVQLPRSTFKVSEPIPVYATIPPPTTSIVVDRGLRLRNMRVELIRVIKIKRRAADDAEFEFCHEGDSSPVSVAIEGHAGTSNGSFSSNGAAVSVQSPTKVPHSPVFPDSPYQTVIARSGASCRFHSTRPIRLRFILHPPSSLRSPTMTQSSLPGSDYGEIGFDADIASISQTTLLHSVAFYLRAHVSFLDTKEQSERTSTLTIPLNILPPPARLPEVSQTIDAAYSKKHDRPPVKTNRYDDHERAAPHYSEGEAGPSMSSAPPPFEERDAPPPFFSSAAEASTSLPTFLESEREVLLPDSAFTSSDLPGLMSVTIEGEGIEFGFHAADQFDGHSEDMQRSMTPPPSMEMAAGDTDLTALTEMQEPSQAIEALNLVLDQHEDGIVSEEQPPPPPPAMDDPSDPPPSIDDSTFRRPEHLEHSPPHSPPPIHAYHDEPPALHLPPGLPPPTSNVQATPGHAPPPYLNTDGHHDQENVIRPPPYYMD
ncbi:hypothetical protein NP233_g10398 [Leucocoprinus birnbaumii]|uniref:ARID domain-containing protein n=1 Tax=Leucocoprinus birnbaumii TaxID=56174 RepID=A0AAD5VII9_9AGAR|nr:hypothetical protein NP233_g10398 [Leucocoprinus birnbaumii]